MILQDAYLFARDERKRPALAGIRARELARGDRRWLAHVPFEVAAKDRLRWR